MTYLNISIHCKAECFNHALFRGEPCSFRLQFTYFTLSLCLFYLSPSLISLWPAGQHNYLLHSVLFPHIQTYIDTATMSHIAPILLLSFLMHLWGTLTRPLTPSHAQINTAQISGFLLRVSLGFLQLLCFFWKYFCNGTYLWR